MLHSIPLVKLIGVISIVYIILFFAFSSGLVNSLIEGRNIPPGMTIIPSRAIQSISETVAMVFILLLGLGGIVLMYYNNRFKTERTKIMITTIGIIILGLSMLLGYMLIDLKT